ncbi:hypothetical protein BH23ACT12_BH23ACT12_15540 [soil metagenome]
MTGWACSIYAPDVDPLGRIQLAGISPFAWYLGSKPLMNGWDLGGIGLLAAVVVLALPVALATFANRDFGT